jgi:hypothetical protein
MGDCDLIGVRTALVLMAVAASVSAQGDLAREDAPVSPEMLALDVRSSGALVDSVERDLRLRDALVARLAVPRTPGVAMQVMAPLGGAAVMLDLEPAPVTGPGFRLLIDRGDGILVQADPGPSRTYRGTVAEIPGSVVAASVLDEGLSARIILPDGRQYWIEPLAAREPGAGIDDHAVYEGGAVTPSGGTCATEAMGVDDGRERPVERGGACGAALCVAQIACDADFLFYQSQGSSVSAVNAAIQSIINAVNVQYERDVQIRHTITTVIVRANNQNLYTNPSPSTMLSDLRNEWNTNQTGVVRDIVHLFTGRDLTGNVIGIASLGVICNQGSGYGLVQPSCCGSQACKADLSAHELGHNWNALHCTCSGFTMNPSITCRNVFSSDSIASITAHRNSRSCLTPFGGTNVGCPGDANDDGVVNSADLTVLLATFGQSVAPGSGADFTNNGLVNGADLSTLLGAFGRPC